MKWVEGVEWVEENRMDRLVLHLAGLPGDQGCSAAGVLSRHGLICFGPCYAGSCHRVYHPAQAVAPFGPGPSGSSGGMGPGPARSDVPAVLSNEAES